MSSQASEEALEDIRLNLELILEFTDAMDREQFEIEYKTQYAVIRALEIAGEAVKRVPQEVRDRDTEVPWKAMGGMRDRLIHAYDRINVDIVWNTVRTTVPEVLPRIRSLLSDTRNS